MTEFKKLTIEDDGEQLMSGASMAGVTLTGANMAEVSPFGTNLTRASLAKAYLANANLTGANLAGANLYGANLAGAVVVVQYETEKAAQQDVAQRRAKLVAFNVALTVTEQEVGA